jgi:hippurate hydrolase
MKTSFDGYEQIVAWRHDFHRHPELLYDVQNTASKVAALLGSFGLDEVATGIGRTGVVGVLHGRGPGGGKVVGLRADMDALPIQEETGKDYESAITGRMHACGHDGHMAMLLGAARCLATKRDFGGTVVFIFQPAEEGGAGGKAMVDDGLMDRWGIQEVYGMHNMPGLPIGRFAIRPGPLMAATDNFGITIHGRGGHAASPHLTVDPMVAANAIVLGLQTIVSRSVDPVEAAVVSVTRFQAGEANNVIPNMATIAGTVRTLTPAVRATVEGRLRKLAYCISEAFDASAEVDWEPVSPVVDNDPVQTNFAVAAAAGVVGLDNVNSNTQPIMVGEDFAYMLAARAGAFIFVGNGESAGLHSSTYDFNDEAIFYGSSYWVRLVTDRLT